MKSSTVQSQLKMQLYLKFFILNNVKASVKPPKMLILSEKHIGAKQPRGKEISEAHRQTFSAGI